MPPGRTGGATGSARRARGARLGDAVAEQLIALDPAFWIGRVTARRDLRADASLDPEFRLVFRQSDSLLRVADPAGGRFLLLFELQYGYDETMPRRMNAYASLAEQKYGLPVCPVLINFQPPPAGATPLAVYESECFGTRVRREFYPVNLWEVPAEEAIQAGSPALLALLPFLQGARNCRCSSGQWHSCAHEHGQDLETFLVYLIRQVGGDEALRRLGARVDMASLRQAPWFQDIVDIGVRETLQRQLEERFGPVPADIEAVLAERSGEQLAALSAVVLQAASLDDFRARLQAG